jgi:hypothetical protein
MLILEDLFGPDELKLFNGNYELMCEEEAVEYWKGPGKCGSWTNDKRSK